MGDGKGWDKGNRHMDCEKKLHSFIYLFFCFNPVRVVFFFAVGKSIKL